MYEGLSVSRLLGVGQDGDAYSYQPCFRLAAVLQEYMEQAMGCWWPWGWLTYPFHSILTPESNPAYHTKSHADYWKPLLDDFPISHHQVVLLDDSPHNLEVAAATGIEGTPVTSSFPVDRALASFLGKRATCPFSPRDLHVMMPPANGTLPDPPNNPLSLP